MLGPTAQREEGACCGLEVGAGQRPSIETAATPPGPGLRVNTCYPPAEGGVGQPRPVEASRARKHELSVLPACEPVAFLQGPGGRRVLPGGAGAGAWGSAGKSAVSHGLRGGQGRHERKGDGAGLAGAPETREERRSQRGMLNMTLPKERPGLGPVAAGRGSLVPLQGHAWWCLCEPGGLGPH